MNDLELTESYLKSLNIIYTLKESKVRTTVTIDSDNRMSWTEMKFTTHGTFESINAHQKKVRELTT